ncbi:MAG: hypothetical protein ACFFDF_08065 [Candidatus Odinarchaeota archaeon]
MKKHDCRYQEICNHYDPESKTCKDDGGINGNGNPYCGKYRELDTLFRDKSRKKLINFKILLLEVISEYDIF